MSDSKLVENRQSHHPRITALLQQFGFRVSVENQLITRVEWGSQADDFAFLDWLVAELVQIEFAFDQPVYPQLEALLTKIDAVMVGQSDQRVGEYQRLGDPTLKVSRSHGKTTPYQHKKNVLAKLELSEFTVQFDQVADKRQFLMQSIMEVLLHDWGKNIIADGDVFQYHAEISYLFTQEWMKTWDEVLQQQFNTARLLDIIRYHHAFQFVDQNQFSIEEVMQALPDLHTLMVLGLFASADAASVKDYTVYSFSTLVETLRFILTQDQSVPEVHFFVKQVAANLLTLATDSGEHLIAKKAKTLEKLAILARLTELTEVESSPELASLLAAVVADINQLLEPITE